MLEKYVTLKCNLLKPLILPVSIVIYDMQPCIQSPFDFILIQYWDDFIVDCWQLGFSLKVRRVFICEHESKSCTNKTELG